METIVVLIWMATIGGEKQLMAVEQPTMEVCLERLETIMEYESVEGDDIGGQKLLYDIKDAEGKCVNMTVDELFAFGS